MSTLTHAEQTYSLISLLYIAAMNTVAALVEFLKSSTYAICVFENIVLSTTGFYGEDRKLLKLLASLCHLTYAPSLVKSYTTHLVCYSLESAKRSEKINKAISWGIPCVNLSWLTDSVTQACPLSVDSYLLNVYKASNTKQDDSSAAEFIHQEQQWHQVRLRKPSSVASSAAALRLQQDRSYPARSPLTSVENVASQMAAVSISHSRRSPMVTCTQQPACKLEDAASPVLLISLQHLLNGHDAADFPERPEGHSDIRPSPARCSDLCNVTQNSARFSSSPMAESPERQSANSVSSFSSPATFGSHGTFSTECSPMLQSPRQIADDSPSDKWMASTPKQIISPEELNNAPVPSQTPASLSQGYLEHAQPIEHTCSTPAEHVREESRLLYQVQESSGTTYPSTGRAAGNSLPGKMDQQQAGLNDKPIEVMTDSPAHAMGVSKTASDFCEKPRSNQDGMAAQQPLHQDKQGGDLDTSSARIAGRQQGIADWTDDESEGFPTPLDTRYHQASEAEDGPVVIARPPPTSAALPLPCDLVAVKLLKAAPRGNCVREHHGLPTLKHVHFAEQVQVAAIRQVLSTKDKKSAVKLPAPAALVAEANHDQGAAPDNRSLPPDVVLGEPVAFYQLPDGDWFLEYQQLYTAQQAQWLAEARETQLSLPFGFDHGNELLKSTIRQHARLSSVQGVVTIRRVKQGGTMLKLKGGTAAGDNLFWRTMIDPVAVRCVTDRPAKDFVDNE